MSYRLRRNLLFVVITAMVVGAIFVLVTRNDTGPAGVDGVAPVGGAPFAAGDTIAGAARGILSPDGSNLVALTPDGLGLVTRGHIRSVTEPGSKVVDVAWFGNGATLLVAEGPVPTGLLAVVDIDGRVRGSVPLKPSVGFGTGYGMAVAPGGKQAVVTAVERPPLGAEEHHLEVVDLETGATRPLTTPGGPDEQRPFYLDGGRVAFVEGSGSTVRTMAIDVARGTVEEVAKGAEIVGVTTGGKPVLVEGASVGLVGRRLGQLPEGTKLTSIHPGSGLAVVAETVVAADGTRTLRLRRVEVDPSR